MKHSPHSINRDSLIRGFLICLLAISTLFFLRSVLRNIGNPEVSDVHGFRQSQTALSVIALTNGGPVIRYETPVVGYPWSIPFEFPLYQVICARLATTFHTPPIATARVVSIIAYLGTLGMGIWLLHLLNISRRHIAVFLILALMSPLYIFWSRTVMIETTALFLGVSFIAFLAAWSNQFQPNVKKNVGIVVGFAVTALLSGSLCAMTKATTFPPIGLLAGLICLAQAVRLWRVTQRIPWLFLFSAFFLLVTPIVPTYLWTRFADTVKNQNPIGIALTSQVLKEWNFGTMDQRRDPQTWYGIADFNAWDTIGGMPILLLILPLFFAVSARWRRLGVSCFLGYLIGPLIFTNLYKVHNYYACGSGLFLIAAVACLIAGLLENNHIKSEGSDFLQRNWRPIAGVVLLLMCFVLQYRTYKARYRVFQDSRSRFFPEVVSVVQKVCPQDKTILAFGFDWSAELPLYARRRALMMPGWDAYNSPDKPAARNAIHRVQTDGGGIGVLVLGNNPQKRAIAGDVAYSHLVKELGFAPKPIYQDGLCAVYAPPIK